MSITGNTGLFWSLGWGWFPPVQPTGSRQFGVWVVEGSFKRPNECHRRSVVCPTFSPRHQSGALQGNPTAHQCQWAHNNGGVPSVAGGKSVRSPTCRYNQPSAHPCLPTNQLSPSTGRQMVAGTGSPMGCSGHRGAGRTGVSVIWGWQNKPRHTTWGWGGVWGGNVQLVGNATQNHPPSPWPG